MFKLFTPADFDRAQAIVYETMAPTPQYTWPLLAARLGCECWVKHENHTPTGAFKVRGGLVHMRLRRERGETGGVITPTRGNHGQSIPFAGAREGIAVTVVVPHGNSREKNAAMKALGAELIEAGADFDEARETASRLARERGLDRVPPFHPELVMGVSTYARELFEAAGDLDAVYVAVGQGSGVCGVIAQRDFLGLKTKVIGVVAEAAASYARSLEAGKIVASATAATFADGIATRVPDPAAFEIIAAGVERIVTVSDDEIADAIRILFHDTHNVAEGAGAAALAALVKEHAAMRGKRVGIILSGGNIDREWFATVLAGGTPRVKPSDGTAPAA